MKPKRGFIAPKTRNGAEFSTTRADAIDKIAKGERAPSFIPT